jgi:hypothetical protein
MGTLFNTTQKEPDGSEFALPRHLEEIYPGDLGDVLTLTAQGYAAKPLGTFTGTNGQQYFAEVLTIATPNIIPPLSFRPKFSTRDVMMIIGDGWLCPRVEQGGFTVNASTGVVTITPGAEYTLYAGLEVTFVYATDDNIAPPTITAISPNSVSVGDTLIITGTGFTANALVQLAGQTVTATYISSTELRVVIPAQNFSGNTVYVRTVTGDATVNGFNFVAPVPTISSFTPTSQQAGNTVVITGTNFVGITAVRFGGVNAQSFVVNSPTQITATVGGGANGAVTVENLYGTGSRNGFTYIETVPTITGFFPTLAAQGAAVVITGTNLSAVTQVQFGDVNAQSFTIDSITQITAIVGTGASGSVSVTNPSGTASLAGFKHGVILPFPNAPNRLATGFTGTLANGVSYTVRASKDWNTNGWTAFDNPINVFPSISYWYATGVTGINEWIEIEFSDAITIGSVDIIPFPLGYQPTDFSFLLADTHNAAGTGYSTVFTRINETWAGTNDETKNYVIPVANRAARKIFRMAVSATVSFGNYPAIYSIILKP